MEAMSVPIILKHCRAASCTPLTLNLPACLSVVPKARLRLVRVYVTVVETGSTRVWCIAHEPELSIPELRGFPPGRP